MVVSNSLQEALNHKLYRNEYAINHPRWKFTELKAIDERTDDKAEESEENAYDYVNDYDIDQNEGRFALHNSKDTVDEENVDKPIEQPKYQRRKVLSNSCLSRKLFRKRNREKKKTASTSACQMVTHNLSVIKPDENSILKKLNPIPSIILNKHTRTGKCKEKGNLNFLNEPTNLTNPLRGLKSIFNRDSTTIIAVRNLSTFLYEPSYNTSVSLTGYYSVATTICTLCDSSQEEIVQRPFLPQVAYSQEGNINPAWNWKWIWDWGSNKKQNIDVSEQVLSWNELLNLEQYTTSIYLNKPDSDVNKTALNVFRYNQIANISTSLAAPFLSYEIVKNNTIDEFMNSTDITQLSSEQFTYEEVKSSSNIHYTTSVDLNKFLKVSVLEPDVIDNGNAIKDSNTTTKLILVFEDFTEKTLKNLLENYV